MFIETYIPKCAGALCPEMYVYVDVIREFVELGLEFFSLFNNWVFWFLFMETGCKKMQFSLIITDFFFGYQ